MALRLFLSIAHPVPTTSEVYISWSHPRSDSVACLFSPTGCRFPSRASRNNYPGFSSVNSPYPLMYLNAQQRSAIVSCPLSLRTQNNLLGQMHPRTVLRSRPLVARLAVSNHCMTRGEHQRATACLVADYRQTATGELRMDSCMPGHMTACTL